MFVLIKKIFFLKSHLILMTSCISPLFTYSLRKKVIQFVCSHLFFYLFFIFFYFRNQKKLTNYRIIHLLTTRRLAALALTIALSNSLANTCSTQLEATATQRQLYRHRRQPRRCHHRRPIYSPIRLNSTITSSISNSNNSIITSNSSINYRPTY